MENKKFWKGATVALSGVLVQVYGLINILYYLFTVIGGCIWSIAEDHSLEYGIEKYMEMYGTENLNFWAVLIIFIVGLIYTNIGVDMLNSNPIRYKEQFDGLKKNFSGYIDNVKSQPSASSTSPNTVSQSTMWECKKCGFVNNGSSRYCADCGKSKDS